MVDMAQVFARTWSDVKFKAKLLSDPHAALAEAGVDLPDGLNVKVLEDTADTQHLVLPAAPTNAGELSAERLEEIASGGAATTVNPMITDWIDKL